MDESYPDNKGRLRCKMLEKPISLYPWQISGVVFIFLKTLGFVPMLGQKVDEHAKKPQVIHALEALIGLPISKDGEIKHAKFLSLPKYRKNSDILFMGGGFIADQTGLGNTIMILFS